MMYYMFKSFIYWGIVMIAILGGMYYNRKDTRLAAIVLVAGLGLGIGMEYLMLNTVPNLVRMEVWNGKVKRVVHDESYTIEYLETYTVSVSDGKGGTRQETRTRLVTDKIPDKFYIDSTIGKYLIKRGDFNNNKAKYGIHMETTFPHRTDKVSYGDGRRFIIDMKDERVPIAKYSKYVNHVTASDSTLYSQMDAQASEKYKTILPEYYSEVNSIYGNMRFDRVKDREAIFSPKEERELQDKLDDYLIETGASKQCNIIVVPTLQSEDYYYGLLDRYKMGNKNDIIVVVGVSNSREIKWVNVSAYTDKSEFIVGLKGDIMDMNILKINPLVKAISDNVSEKYIRRPMEEMSYLSTNIYIPGGKQVFYAILSILSLGLVCIFIKK